MGLAATREAPKIDHFGAGGGGLRRFGECVNRFTILSGYKIGEGGIGWRGNFENELFHRSIIRSTPRLAAAGAARLEGKKNGR
jgi:hypothetical protein